MLRYINGMSGNADHDVEVHATLCRDAVAKVACGDYDDAGEVPRMSPAELWEEYNADFMEDPWTITVFPCTRLVDKKMDYAGV